MNQDSRFGPGAPVSENVEDVRGQRTPWQAYVPDWDWLRKALVLPPFYYASQDPRLNAPPLDWGELGQAAGAREIVGPKMAAQFDEIARQIGPGAAFQVLEQRSDQLPPVMRKPQQRAPAYSRGMSSLARQDQYGMR